MSKGGRPALSAEDRRIERSVYLSEREMNSVKLRAAEAGLAVPVFMRSSLASSRIVATPTASVDQWSQLAPLASNINQIAKRLNTSAAAQLNSDDLDLLHGLDELLRSVRLHLLSVEPSS